ncbi:MAG: hypothetical protein ABIY55_06930, partial [Kofleriaceae bacterium]
MASSSLTLTTYRTTGPVNTQLVAFQDGDGPWTVLSGVAGVYTATLTSGRYGVMTSCVSTAFGGGSSILYGTVSDGTKLYSSDCEEPSAAAANISGNVTGAAPANPIRVFAPSDTVNLAAGVTTYSSATVAGPAKLVAAELVN